MAIVLPTMPAGRTITWTLKTISLARTNRHSTSSPQRWAQTSNAVHSNDDMTVRAAHGFPIGKHGTAWPM